MDLSIKTTTYAQDDHSWLGSKHGMDECSTVTLDVSTFTAGTHYPNGFLLSGLPLMDVGGNKHGLWTTGNDLAGFLAFAVKTASVNTTDVSGAMLERGRVITDNLPVAVDSAGQTSNPRFIFA